VKAPAVLKFGLKEEFATDFIACAGTFQILETIVRLVWYPAFFVTALLLTGTLYTVNQHASRLDRLEAINASQSDAFVKAAAKLCGQQIDDIDLLDVRANLDPELYIARLRGIFLLFTLKNHGLDAGGSFCEKELEILAGALGQ